MREIQIQKAIAEYLQYLENQGKLYFKRTNSFAGTLQRTNGSTGWIKNNKPGCPDFVVCVNGFFVGLEVKGPTGQQSKVQKEAEQKILKCGGDYFIVKSVDKVIRIITNRLKFTR